MADADVGRLPVVARDARLLGILTRSDLVSAHRRRLADARRAPRRPEPGGGGPDERAPARG